MSDIHVTETQAGMTIILATSEIGVAALRLIGAPDDKQAGISSDQTMSFVDWALSVPLALTFGPLPAES